MEVANVNIRSGSITFVTKHSTIGAVPRDLYFVELLLFPATNTPLCPTNAVAKVCMRRPDAHVLDILCVVLAVAAVRVRASSGYCIAASTLRLAPWFFA